MPLCPNCHNRVKYGSDGWYCTCCFNQGAPDLIVSDWEEGLRRNAPYRGEPSD